MAAAGVGAGPISDSTLRKVLIGSPRQAFGASVCSLAGVCVIAVGVGGWVFEDLRVCEKQALWGLQAYVLGPLFVLVALVVLLIVPQRVGPRKIGGSRARAIAARPDYRKMLRRELHISAIYRAKGYLFRVLLLVVLWLAAGSFFAVRFGQVWSDPDVTVRMGAYVAPASMGLGLLAALLMMPTLSQVTASIDEAGDFVPSLGTNEPKAMVTMTNDVPTPLEAPQPLWQSVSPGSSGRRGGVRRPLLIALFSSLLTIGVVVGVVAYLALGQGQAASPNTIAGQFKSSGVTCRSLRTIFDDRSSKSLGCTTTDNKLISITTYGKRPAEDEWLALKCKTWASSSNALQKGIFVVGKDFILDMNQLAVFKGMKVTPLKQTAAALAQTLGGTTHTYDCTKP